MQNFVPSQGRKIVKTSLAFKRAMNEFNEKLHKTGKNLLNPKCYCSLKVDQETLDQHKSSNMLDKNCNIPLDNLENPPPGPSLLKKFNKSSFSYDDFFEILSTCRYAPVVGLDGIPYKVYKKCSKIRKFIFKIFQACVKDVKFPFNGSVLKRYTFPKLEVHLRTNSQTFVQ